MDINKVKEFLKRKSLEVIATSVLLIVFALTVGIICFNKADRELHISEGGVPLSGAENVYNATFFVNRGIGSSGSYQANNYLRVGSGYFKRANGVNLQDVSSIDFNGPDCSYLLQEDELVVWDKIQKVSGRFFVLGHIEKNPEFVHVKKNELTFASVSAMAAADLSVGSEVFTEGYYAANDGGGAEYVIVDSLKSATNKVGIVALNDGKYAELKLGDTITLKQFGAVGDGVIDDTEAINNAVSCAKGRLLIVPNGTYVVSSVINVPSNFHMAGQGDSSKFIAAPDYGVGKDFFRARSQKNITIEQICIDGNSAYNSHEKGHSAVDGIHMFDIWNCSNVHVKNCTFQNNVYVAIRIVGESSNLSFTNNMFSQVDCGVITLGGGNMDGITVKDNYFDGHQNSEPISLYGQGNVKNVVIDHNTVLNKTFGSAIFVGNGGKYETVQITNNYLSKDANGIVCTDVTNLIISGNVAEDTSSGSGIKLVNCSNADVFSNTVARTAQNGFYIKGCTNISVYQNLISDCGYVNNDYFPMDVRGDCSNVSIYSNRFERTDNALHEIFVACRSTGSVSFSKNEYVNCRVWLGKESSGVNIREAGVAIKNDSKSNSVEKISSLEQEEVETINPGAGALEETVPGAQEETTPEMPAIEDFNQGADNALDQGDFGENTENLDEGESEHEEYEPEE